MTSPLQQTMMVATAAVALSSTSILAAGDGWITDFDEAKTTAEKANKDLLMDFTGSDWCHWCIQLKQEVFSKDEFKSAVPEHFILLELDYPEKLEQSASLKKQNELLRDFYEVQGYPTIVLTDAEGRAYAKTGYQKGGPENYVSHLNELRQIRVKRDEAFAKAEKASGLEKAKLLQSVFTIIGDEGLVRKHYSDVGDQIIELDTEDTLGFRANREFQNKLDALDIDINSAARAGAEESIPQLIDSFILAHKLVGEQKQRALLGKIGVHFQLEQHKESLRVAKRVAAIDPTTVSGKNAADLVLQIEKYLKKQAEEK